MRGNFPALIAFNPFWKAELNNFLKAFGFSSVLFTKFLERQLTILHSFCCLKKFISILSGANINNSNCISQERRYLITYRKADMFRWDKYHLVILTSRKKSCIVNSPIYKIILTQVGIVGSLRRKSYYS